MVHSTASAGLLTLAVLTNSVLLVAEQLQLEKCSGEHIQSALSVISQCKPREVVIQLPWPNNTDIQQMTPSHVLVQQCTGGCTQLEPSCLPSRTRARRIPVLVAKCGITLGICDKECATIEVEEHIECKCACALTPADCRLPGQQFVAADCACRCSDAEARRACLEQAGRVWDDSTCECACALQSADCTVGHRLEHTSCTCQEDVGGGGSVGVVELVRRNETAGPSPLLSLEMLLIVFLVSVVVVLGLLGLCLACKLRRLQKDGGLCGGGARSPLVPSTLSGAYLSTTDPCSDLKETPDIYNKEPCTDSSVCSSHSDNSDTSDTLPCATNANLAIRVGTLTRQPAQRTADGTLRHMEGTPRYADGPQHHVDATHFIVDGTMSRGAGGSFVSCTPRHAGGSRSGTLNRNKPVQQIVYRTPDRNYELVCSLMEQQPDNGSYFISNSNQESDNSSYYSTQPVTYPPQQPFTHNFL